MVSKDLLKNVYLFKDMLEDELSRLAGIAKSKSMATGDAVFREGEAATALYVIKFGSVRLKHGARSEDVAVATLGAGSHFGEMGFVDDVQRTASAEALEHTELLQIDYSDLSRVLKEHPMMAMRFYRSMAHFLATRLRQTTHDLAFAREARLHNC